MPMPADRKPNQGPHRGPWLLPSTRTSTATLRGSLRLTRDGVLGLADLVEAMHRQIANPLGAQPDAGQPARTRGITGLVYKSIRGVTRLVGGSGDALLAALAACLPDARDARTSDEREAVLAALNGVLGDRLVASGNPLAITMALRRRGIALRLQPASLAASLPDAGPRPLVLLHGLCMNDRQWQREGHDHGEALARDLGCTPVYLHYNTGRSIADNGRDFAGQMEALIAAWPVELQGLSLLAHSMGGLVARSAIEQGRRAGHAWVGQLDRVVFLGTPHHGAPLERAGHGIDLLLGASRYSAPLARLTLLRSAGITDLRHGELLAASGKRSAASREPVPLPEGVACFTVAATLGPADAAKSQWLGDGLVPLPSALGRHADPRQSLAFDADRQWVAEGVGHLQLLSDAAVYQWVHDGFAMAA
jgi:PGAP1-like protein